MSAQNQRDLLLQMLTQLPGAGAATHPIVGAGQAQATSMLDGAASHPVGQAMALLSLLSPQQAASPELPGAKNARGKAAHDVAAVDQKRNLIAQNVWFFGKISMAERVLNLRRMEPDIISSETVHLKPDVR